MEWDGLPQFMWITEHSIWESIILDTYVLWPYTGAMMLGLSHGEYREMPQKPLFQIFMPMKSTMLVCVREHWLSKIVVYKIWNAWLIGIH